jgi:putative membrane protein
MSDHLTPSPSHSADEFQRVLTLERPHEKLWTYYLLCCVLLGPLFFVLVIPQYFRYHTMRYRFDEQGVRMSWGILFRREVSLAYARIQDIHLNSNLIERWLGLAKIQISTASGSSSAEMTIEGFLEYELVRDFLYAKMRGSHHPTDSTATGSAAATAAPAIAPADVDSVVAALQQVSDDLRAVRLALEKRQS